MVLLTSSTVSVILTSGVVCTFTFLLFLSGYVLQQQSVRNIQDALKPSPPTPIAKRETDTYGHNVRYYDGDDEQQVLPGFTSNSKEYSASRHHQGETRNRGNYAYLQLLSSPDPSDVCSAILFFKTLATNGTAIQDRLFMYPQEWDRMTFSPPSNDKKKKKNKNKSHQKPQKLTKSIAKALSLLRSASIKYNIWLLPIDMTPATSAGYRTTDTKLLRLGQIQFMQYDSVLYVQTPGLLLDTEKLDSMLLSRPLPMKHDKNRRESYDNEAWTPMPLLPDRDEKLPPVYLIAVNNVRGRVEARGHIPNFALKGFGNLVTGPSGVDNGKRGSSDGRQPQQQPGYVFFERDYDGRVSWKGNPVFGAWRAQQYEVCDGLDLNDDDIYDEE